jgi:hypothetical protein
MARTTINISFYNGDSLSLFMVRSGLSGYAAHHIDPSLTLETEEKTNEIRNTDGSPDGQMA